MLIDMQKNKNCYVLQTVSENYNVPAIKYFNCVKTNEILINRGA